jgi:hypothetical protein
MGITLLASHWFDIKSTILMIVNRIEFICVKEHLWYFELQEDKKILLTIIIIIVVVTIAF